MMYIAVTHFIEAYTGNWLGNILRERVWEPLAMNNTFFALSDAEAATSTGKASLARGYEWQNRTQEYRVVSYMDSDAVSGAGAVISNVLDYAKWLRCMMNMAAPLSQAAHESLRLPRSYLPPITLFGVEHPGSRGGDAYALGWLIGNYRGEVVISHPGNVPGFTTMMAYLPRRKRAFAIMANTGEGGVAADEILSYRLLDDMLGIPQSERLPWSPVVDRVNQQATEMLRNPKKYLYPNSPVGDDVIPLTLPLSRYAGV